MKSSMADQGVEDVDTRSTPQGKTHGHEDQNLFGSGYAGLGYDHSPTLPQRYLRLRVGVRPALSLPAPRGRRLARDYERLGETLEGLHYVAFSLLMLHRAAPQFCWSS
jgi:hypothetical protein